MTVSVPESAGEYVTLQVEEAPLPERVQVAELKVPEAVLANDTVPVGVTVVPDAVSVTVAVHVEEEPTSREEGEQSRPVEVLRSGAETAREKVPELP